MAALVGNHHRKDRKFGELPGLNNPRQRRAKPEREGVETIIDPSHRDDGIVQTTNGENRRRKTKWDVIRVSLDRSQHRAPFLKRATRTFYPQSTQEAGYETRGHRQTGQLARPEH